jgi:HSP20 family molecular chaperone IbpA
VEQDKMRADLKHGVLTLSLPKAEEAKPRKIAVSVS